MVSVAKKVIFLLLFCFFSALFVSRVLSYNDTITHPSFTGNITQVYNANFDKKLSDQDINWLKQGSIEEDIPIRWMNHFYEPNTNKGIWGFSSSKDWAQNPTLQSGYIGMKGDQSWQKAIDSYAKGDEKSAFIALGHILHLIEDATVPAHTRLDAHIHGDPYERWVEESIGANINFDVQPVVTGNLSDAFYQLAVHSNRYFLSEDTIENDELKDLLVTKRTYNGLSKECLIRSVSGVGFCLIVVRTSKFGQTSYFIDEPIVNSDYFNLLGPKAVSYGAGVIKLFFDEAEKKKQEQKQENWWEKTKNWFDSKKSLLSGSVVGALPSLSTSSGQVSLPNNLIVNQAALDQLVGNQGNDNPSNSPQPSLIPSTSLRASLREGEKGGASIVNLTPRNFPSTSSGRVPSTGSTGSPQASPEEVSPVVNIIPNLPLALSSSNGMVLGETTGNGNEKHAATTAETSAKTSVSNPTVPLGAGAKPSAPTLVEETIQQSESPTVTSTPTEETASTTEEDLISPASNASPARSDAASSGERSDAGWPETYATSTPILNSSTSSPQTIATSTIIFEFSSSQATSTFQCSLDNATSTVCVSPVEYNNLSDGEHSFEVKAVGAAGNIDPTPVIFNWTVNLPQEISLTLINYQMVSFDFSVAWNSGSTNIASYEIQYKIGEDGEWLENWVSTTTSGQKSFRAERGDTIYYFRGRVTDNQNNQSDWQQISAPISRYPVAINEIAWMGTGSSTELRYDEWIELYNNVGWNIDLTGWTLSSTDGNPSINLAGTIPAKGFYLLERTDDNTVFDVTADQIYPGAGPSQNMMTNGSSEKLELRDGFGYLIDSTPTSETWVAGIASPDYKTMERVTPYMPGADPLFWATYDGTDATDINLAADGTPIHGTPKARNSVYSDVFWF